MRISCGGVGGGNWTDWFFCLLMSLKYSTFKLRNVRNVRNAGVLGQLHVHVVK